MNTPPKVKLYTERTRAKDRTTKNKKGRNGRTQRSDESVYRWPGLGEGSKPDHAARSINREGLNGIFTRSDVFLTVPSHDDHTHTEAADPSEQNRWNRRLAKRRKTVLNRIFKTGGDK